MATAWRTTVEEYHRMIGAGAFAEDERFELLEEKIVPKFACSPPHAVALVLAHDALRSLLPPDYRVRVRSSITTADSEPEPDLTIVRGVARDFSSRHPGPGDIALVVEVADSSLAQDRGLKARLYARAALPVYWIINLIDRTVEVHTDPTGPAPNPSYRQREVFGATDSVPLALAGHEVGRVAVRELLP